MAMSLSSCVLLILAFSIPVFGATAQPSLRGNKVDGDIYRDVAALVQTKGYPFESHETVTDDGYILTLHRIPKGKNPHAPFKGVVMFQHGILCGSDCWVMNSEERSLPFVLANEGYDVWMTNNRGTPYSNKHTRLGRWSSAYWDFSFHDMAMFDVPANIDYILAHTNVSQLTYVGHSQGTSQMFASLTLKSDLASKVNLFIAVTPVSFLLHQSFGLLTTLARSGVGALLMKLGVYEFNPTNTLLRDTYATVCALPLLGSLCQGLVGLIDTKTAASVRAPVYLSHAPVSTSTKCLLHFAQFMEENTFAQYNYGTDENFRRYGTAHAPAYELSKIHTPMVFFSGSLDPLGDPRDVEYLSSVLPEGLVKEHINYEDYGHVAFLGSDDVEDRFIPDMLRVLKQYVGPITSSVSAPAYL
eukprot:GILK01009590.1.p1 GENE.GILK01009590.1~~GILK01009590.1.p1  ORF type:complete len:421 (+),score=59.40 GILK01009590.1:23-1264(+)